MDNYDQEIERKYHPENFKESNEVEEEGQQLLDLLKDAVDDLHEYSVYNDDLFNGQLAEIDEQIEQMKQILAFS